MKFIVSSVLTRAHILSRSQWQLYAKSQGVG